MHPILTQIFKTKQFVNGRNESVTIHSETSLQQCQFLQDIVLANKFKSAIEIGLAFGISALAVLEAIVQNGGKSLAIDKFQTEVWDGNGTDLIMQSGYKESFEFIEDYSYNVLPLLLQQNRKFDFAYIDTTKLIDYLMVDFFYLDKLLEVNGIIVFDDATFPGIRKLLRYIAQFPHYEVYDQYPKNSPSGKPKKLIKLLKSLPKWEGQLREEIRVTDFELGVNSHCIALRKKEEDKRNYDWFMPF